MQLSFHFRETWLHRVNPSLKLAVLVVVFIWMLLTHNLNTLMNYTYGSLILLLCFTGHPWKRLLLYCAPFVLIFISTSTSMIFFGKGETTWVHWGLLHITEESFFRGVHLGFRALNFAMIGLLFALTTRPLLLFYSLMQQCRLSPKYAYSFMAGLRLIPMMFEEFQVIRHALKVRGLRHSRGIKGFYTKLKHYAVPLLAQSIRRAQRIAVAMEAKRFSAINERTYYYQVGYSRYDAWFIGYVAAAGLLAWLLSQYVPYFSITDVRYFE